MIKRGSVTYTDKWKGYGTLTVSRFKHMAANHGKMFAKGSVHINGIEGFWSFAKKPGKISRSKGKQVYPIHQGD